MERSDGVEDIVDVCMSLTIDYFGRNLAKIVLLSPDDITQILSRVCLHLVKLLHDLDTDVGLGILLTFLEIELHEVINGSDSDWLSDDKNVLVVAGDVLGVALKFRKD